MAETPGDALREFMGAFGNGDVGTIDRLLAKNQPVLFIGTDPGEWWDDRARLLEVYEIQLKEMGGPKVELGDVNDGSQGDAGWASAQATIQIPDGPTFAMRVSAAMLREDGEWRIVQGHASVGAANEDTVGTELTV